jgi:hypothetical protein
MQRMPRSRITPRGERPNSVVGIRRPRTREDVGRGMQKPDSFMVRGAQLSPYRVLKTHPNNTSF